MGQIIGQPLGGLLAHPEQRFPTLFDVPFWNTYPFALPCFIAATFALVTVFVGCFTIDEVWVNVTNVFGHHF